jgi:hypothetical protein
LYYTEGESTSSCVSTDTEAAQYLVHTQHGDVCGKPLVEPDVRPPPHGDQVAEPLVCQLVGYNVRDGMLAAHRRYRRVVQDCGLSANTLTRR